MDLILSNQVERHTLLKFFRGVSNTDSLDGTSDEEIQSALGDQFISKDYTLIGQRGNKLLPLHTLFFTSQVPSFSASIHVGYETVPVHLYIPNPTWCYQCQKCGHTWQRCASHLVCGHGEDVMSQLTPLCELLWNTSIRRQKVPCFPE